MQNRTEQAHRLLASLSERTPPSPFRDDEEYVSENIEADELKRKQRENPARTTLTFSFVQVDLSLGSNPSLIQMSSEKLLMFSRGTAFLDLHPAFLEELLAKFGSEDIVLLYHLVRLCSSGVG